MFYNQIINLFERCYYSDRKLALLRASCVWTAAQTIAVVISGTPGFKDEIKNNMALKRLTQGFRVSAGNLNVPEVRKFCHGPKLTNTVVNDYELTHCFVFAYSNKLPGKLEVRFVVDLARFQPV